MVESKSLPQFKSLEELIEFFETHDLGEYWDHIPAVHFDIDIKRKAHTFTIDEDLAERLTAISKSKRIPSEALINIWLREKISEQT